MNRRDFLINSGLAAAGTFAVGVLGAETIKPKPESIYLNVQVPDHYADEGVPYFIQVDSERMTVTGLNYGPNGRLESLNVVRGK
jgi:hypothetical protein